LEPHLPPRNALCGDAVRRYRSAAHRVRSAHQCTEARLASVRAGTRAQSEPTSARAGSAEVTLSIHHQTAGRTGAGTRAAPSQSHNRGIVAGTDRAALATLSAPQSAA